MLNKRGLTFIELIVAILIMSLGVVAIMWWGPGLLRAKADTERLTESTFLASDKLEEIKGKILDDYDLAGGYAVSSTAFPAPYTDYRYSITDDDYNIGMGTVPDIREISISAWHIEESDNPVTLYTKVARR
jgi:prepilin-type N-terminal cleavage/methylation domain-containing protein